MTWWPLTDMDILDHLTEHPHATAEEIAAEWNDDVESVRDHLEELEAAGKVTGTGQNSHRRWTRGQRRGARPPIARVPADPSFDDIDRMMRTNRGPV